MHDLYIQHGTCPGLYLSAIHVPPGSSRCLYMHMPRIVIQRMHACCHGSGRYVHFYTYVEVCIVLQVIHFGCLALLADGAPL